MRIDWQPLFSHLNISETQPITFDAFIVPELWIPDLIFLGTTSERRHTGRLYRLNNILFRHNGESLLSRLFGPIIICRISFKSGEIE